MDWGLKVDLAVIQVERKTQQSCDDSRPYTIMQHRGRGTRTTGQSGQEFGMCGALLRIADPVLNGNCLEGVILGKLGSHALSLQKEPLSAETV